MRFVLVLALAAAAVVLALPAASAHTTVGFASCTGTLVGPFHGGAAIAVFPQAITTADPVVHVHVLVPYGTGTTCLSVAVQTPV